MVKTWVLMFALLTPTDGVSTHSIEFNSRTACETAEEKIKEWFSSAALVSCVPVYPNQN